MKELEVVNSPGIPSEHEMLVFQAMAKAAVDSKMYRGVGDISGVMMIMLSARELGIPPVQALNGGLNIIQGKVEISARMMNALVRKAGHKIIIKQISDTGCTLQGVRCNTGETQTTTFSIEDAQRAGLVKSGGGWNKFPQDMCYARALSRLARQLFPDVIGIGYVEGEIQAIDIQPDSPIVDGVDMLAKLMSTFPECDHQIVLEYIHVVMKHFGWSRDECVSKFLNDKDFIEKFNDWKSRITIKT